jgi:antitoxin component HigA of HigAB toxin-antitoxin module
MIRTGRRKRSRVTDTYFALVQRFPLRAIKSAREHAEALAFLTETSLAYQGTRDSGVLDYLETLARLIEDFEKREGYGVDLTGLSPRSSLNHLMEVHHLNVTQLAAIMGTSQGTLSEIRQGRRGVSKEMIRKLVSRFGIDPRVFL